MLMKKNNENLPVVAIVGRPNVGKSTLFNKLVKRKKAIVSPKPGVTRDRNMHDVKLNKMYVRLIDTGGYTVDKDDDFKSYIQKQSKIAIEEADFIIFMVEYEDVTQDDYELAKVIRDCGKDYVLAVNKVDNEKRENYIYQHYELNLGEPLPISVMQNKNLDLLFNIIEEKIPLIKTEKIEPEEPNIKISIVGKPNTGKSSLLNLLLGEERSIVTDTPGTTRDSVEGVIEYKNNNVLFVDTAGIRRKNKVHEDIEFYSVRRAINSIEHCDIVVLMIDAEENITDQDKKIAGIALQRLKALIIVVNKWDLMTKEYKSFRSYEDYIRFRFAVTNFVPVINISVLKNKNIQKLLDLIIKVNAQYNQRVETGEFNRFLQQVIEMYPPKLKRRGKFKIYYGTQTSKSPVKFVFFCNNPDNCPPQYRNYLVNRIREKYGFDGIPIGIKLKGRNNKNGK